MTSWGLGAWGLDMTFPAGISSWAELPLSLLALGLNMCLLPAWVPGPVPSLGGERGRGATPLLWHPFCGAFTLE